MRSWNSSTSMQTARPLRRRPGVGLAQQDLDRPVDLVVEVDGTFTFELGAVLRPHLGETVDVAAVPPFDLEPGRRARGGSRSTPRSTAPPGRCCAASGSRSASRARGGRRVRRSCATIEAWARNGGTPLTMASAIELSVRTCSPRRSAVRSRISSWARLLKATRLTALGGSRQPTSRWRARSVSTRVLPDPAGAMMRAAPPAWTTAASWSGARSAPEALDIGSRE